MKSTHHRFDYTRFGEAFVERDLLDTETLHHVLTQCQATRTLLPEILVMESLVSDWEVSRVACELYHLPFLTVNLYEPDRDTIGLFDANFLRRFALVPLDRYGDLLTVVMPGLVPSDVLEGLRFAPSLKMVPVVGSVASNRQWLNEHLPGPMPAAAQASGAPVLPALPADATLEASNGDDAWLNIFDAGEQAVQLDVKSKQDP